MIQGLHVHRRAPPATLSYTSASFLCYL